MRFTLFFVSFAILNVCLCSHNIWEITDNVVKINGRRLRYNIGRKLVKVGVKETKSENNAQESNANRKQQI